MQETEPEQAKPGKRGPRPGAEQADVIAIARRRFFEEQAFDTSAIAAEAGIGRTTLWRWFGSRDAFLGEVLSELGVETLEAILREPQAGAGSRFLTVLERYFAAVTSSKPLLALIRRDPVGTVGVLMAPSGAVYRRLVDATERVLKEDAERGYSFAVEPHTLANLTVEIGMVHVWANFLTNEPPNVQRAVEAIRALVSDGRT